MTTMLPNWACGSQSFANLFNPALGSVLLWGAAGGHASTAADGSGLPFCLAFLVLPMALHGRTIDALPRSKATTLVSWARREEGLVAGLPTRVRALAPATREAIVLAIRHQLLVVRKGVFLPAGKLTKSQALLRREHPELLPQLSAAKFLGCWFAQSGEQNVFGTLGLAPCRISPLNANL
jgi:hypothetical protein